jgi:putative ABC transport system permease protein
MSIFFLSWRSIIAKPLSSLLSWLLLTFGVLIVLLILLIANGLKSEIGKNAQGIDLVIGAKGSPLQIILCNVFHVDFPTGNISLKEAATVSRSRYIERAIPVSLGDSYRGARIVGTTQEYPGLYNAGVLKGVWFEDHMEVVLGAGAAKKLGLKVGDTFESQHGLSEDADSHGGHPFIVVGILESTGTVVDQLILTSLESIWAVHGHDEHEELEDSLMTIDHLKVTVTQEQYEEEDITSLLIKYRSPMGAVMLPRAINAESNLQAASPAFEAARLFNIIGVGVEILNYLGLLIIIISGLSVFLSLLNSLKDRRYDIAIMRSMGATAIQIFSHILIEGMIITVVGVVSGLALAHGLVYILASNLEGVSPESFYFINEEWLVLVGCVVIGLISSIIPALVAYRTDISETLAKG